MNELINGRTPEDIKAALHICVQHNRDKCDECPYDKKCGRKDEGLLQDCIALIERLEARAPKWISVEERLPRCGERVLVTNDGSVWEAYLSISHKWVRQEFVWAAKVTHWMTLPEPPEEGE